jgi:hypothetical protein
VAFDSLVQLFFKDMARAQALVRIFLKRPLTRSGPPMPFQALRGNARAHRSAIGHALGGAGFIPVEEHTGERGQCVDLQETAVGHGGTP